LRQVRNDVGAVNVLVNNAGIVRGKVFWENDPVRDIGLTMNVNAIAPMYITREFLPSMMDSAQPCRIVNIASAAGLTPTPTMAVYGGSKAAALTWSESLRVELVRAGYGHVQVPPNPHHSPSTIGVGPLAPSASASECLVGSWLADQNMLGQSFAVSSRRRSRQSAPPSLTPGCSRASRHHCSRRC
jgi:NAD(P)-dependent dehydrogenase (short-subunit alcohol dehydrogenase family)